MQSCRLKSNVQECVHAFFLCWLKFKKKKKTEEGVCLAMFRYNRCKIWMQRHWTSSDIIFLTAPISDGRVIKHNPSCELDDCPVLSSQQAVPVVQKEHSFMLSPQIRNPLANKDNLQSKDSLAKTPRRSTRTRNKPNCLQLVTDFFLVTDWIHWTNKWTSSLCKQRMLWICFNY